MISNAIKVRRGDVEAIVSAAFPSYRGRKFRVQPAESVTLGDTFWDGGSRSQYTAVRLADGLASAANVGQPWSGVEGKSVPVPPGVVIVEHSIFCGKDCGLRIYVHPVDMPRLLPAAADVVRS